MIFGENCYDRHMHDILNRPAAKIVRALAEQHGITYVATDTDAWANQVTRLAGDDVELDEIELLLIALQRSGHLSRPDALALQARYLREASS